MQPGAASTSTTRPTAEEWLDAHYAAQAAEEADETREITEADVAAEECDIADHQTVAAPHHGELSVPDDDIRERSTPDPTERVDPRERRRVPIPDETQATVERARIAAAEVKKRRADEAARDTPDDMDGEDIRRDQLNQWATAHEDAVAARVETDSLAR